MLIIRLNSMIKTCAFLIFHRDLQVITPTQYLYYIDIKLSRIYHEPFEIHIQHNMFFHDLNEFFHILELHLTNCNGLNTTIKRIIKMLPHGCPLSHTFAVVKHQPYSFQIPSWLHVPHSINPNNRTINRHLK